MELMALPFEGRDICLRIIIDDRRFDYISYRLVLHHHDNDFGSILNIVRTSPMDHHKFRDQIKSIIN